MPKPPPAALGDAYPALRNFLKLTALTLEVHQVALTVQVGSRPYSTGALSYGPVTQAALRQMLQQPQPALAAITETLSLGTLYHNISLAPSWSQASPEPEELPEVQEPLEELRPTASEASPRPAHVLPDSDGGAHPSAQNLLLPDALHSGDGGGIASGFPGEKPGLPHPTAFDVPAGGALATGVGAAAPALPSGYERPCQGWGQPGYARQPCPAE